MWLFLLFREFQQWHNKKKPVSQYDDFYVSLCDFLDRLKRKARKNEVHNLVHIKWYITQEIFFFQVNVGWVTKHFKAHFLSPSTETSLVFISRFRSWPCWWTLIPWWRSGDVIFIFIWWIWKIYIKYEKKNPPEFENWQECVKYNIDISFYIATFKCLKMDNYKPVNLWTK